MLLGLIRSDAACFRLCLQTQLSEASAGLKAANRLNEQLDRKGAADSGTEVGR